MIAITLACTIGGLPQGDYVEITSPTYGAKFEEGTPIQFMVTIHWKDAGVGTQSVTWSSSKDGVIGEGGTLIVSDLTVGTHQIQVTARGAEPGISIESSASDQVTIEVYESSDPPDTDPAAGCTIPSDRYTWSYEDFELASGNGGTTCNARFVFQNETDEAGYLIVFTTWDNDAMESAKWSTFRVETGDDWEYRVSLVLYKNGDVTFSQVEKILFIRSNTECANLLSNKNEAIWADRAVPIDPLPCE